MTVAIPLLWGIPPRHETLRYVVVDLQAALSCSKVLTMCYLQYRYHVWWRLCREGV